MTAASPGSSSWGGGGGGGGSIMAAAEEEQQQQQRGSSSSSRVCGLLHWQDYSSRKSALQAERWEDNQDKRIHVGSEHRGQWQDQVEEHCGASSIVRSSYWGIVKQCVTHSHGQTSGSGKQ